MQRSSFILGVALFVVAATLAITITLREPAESEVVTTSRPSSRAPDARPRPRASSSGLQIAGKRSNRRASNPPRFSVSAPASHPDGALLAEKARMVENESRAHLERLSEKLELTGEQRRRLFPILARTSEHYDPALVISGLQLGSSPLSGVAGNRELNQVLDPPQRDQLIEEAMTDQILWEEIIDKLRRRLDEETPKIPGDASPPVEPPASNPRGRGNLFDSIDPPQ